MAELADVHPELFHYTGISGLESILNNQSLRATHASFLNDTTEVNAFKERLLEILLPVVKNDVYERHKLPVGREHIEQQGGAAKVIDDAQIADVGPTASAKKNLQPAWPVRAFALKGREVGQIRRIAANKGRRN